VCLKKGAHAIQTAALAGGIIRTVIFCGLLFSTIKYFKFPKGTIFFALLAEAVGIGFMGGQFQYIFSALIAGFLTELVYDMSYHRLHKHHHLRIFGFLIPVVFFIPYVLVSMFYSPSWWSVHMIAGMIVVNGIVGWLMTYLIEPPKPHDYPTLRS
jgi:asparagine N-glycosylation enzyme membrane subunit Stt3